MKRSIGNGVGPFYPQHAQLKQNILQQVLLFIIQVAFGLLLQQSERINSLARADEINTGLLLAFLAEQAQLDKRAHVKRFNHRLKGHLRHRAGHLAGALLDHLFQFLARGLIGLVLFVLFLSGGRRRHLLGLRRGLSFRRGLCLSFLVYGRRSGWRWRRRSRFFFFYHRRIGPQFTFRSKPAAVRHNKLCFLFVGHISSVLFNLKRRIGNRGAGPIQL